MLYCERCGLANREGSRFCNGCGQALSNIEPSQEPLPPWLRDAAVAGYLWKGDVLLPSWLGDVRPFRELYGGSAVVLPPPYEEVTLPPETLNTGDPSGGEEITFLDMDEVDDEEGPMEGELLLLDDLDLATPAPDELGDDQSDGPDAGATELETATTRELMEPALEGAETEADPRTAETDRLETAPEPAEAEELCVEVVAPVRSDHEPTALLDDTGVPLPVMDTPPHDEEELVAVVSLEPEDEPLLQGIADETRTVENAPEEYVRPELTPVAAPDEDLNTARSDDAVADDERGQQDSPTSSDEVSPFLAAIAEFNAVPSRPFSGKEASQGVTESGQRFRSAAEYMLGPSSKPKAAKKRRRKDRRS